MPNKLFAQYITKEGDRPDLIAHKYYGSVDNMVDMIEANPDIQLLAIYPSGLNLRIPVIESAISSVPDSKLPPWKRK